MIVTDPAPFNDPLTVDLADAIASVADARIRFVFAVEADAPAMVVEAIEDYHAELDDRCSVPVAGTIVRGGGITVLITELEAADPVVVSTTTHRLLPDLFFSPDSDRVATRLESTTLLVHSCKSRRATLLEPIVERILFR